MKNAAAPAELSRAYLWNFPGAPIRIHLRLSAVSKIREYLLNGVDPDPTQCRERGGLLLGTVRTNNVDVTDFEPFRPDRPERHFVLSSPEKELLGLTLQNGERDSSVVGYFRSDFRRGVQLYEEDLALARQFFSHPAQVFLVVRIDQEMTPDAGFFFWDGGGIFSEATFMQFPFDERLLPSQEVTPPAPPVVQVAQPVSQPAAPPQPKPIATKARRSKVPYLIAGLSVALVAGGYALFPYLLPYLPKRAEEPNQPEPAARQPVSSPTLLSVSQLDKTVEVTWDSQLPAFADARIGVLTIKDGDWQVELPLTKVQLQMNKLIYPPKTDQLEVTLEVFSSTGKSTKEAAMFLRQPAVRWRSVAVAPPTVAKPNPAGLAAALASASQQGLTDDSPASSAPVRTFQAHLVPRPKAPEPAVVTEAPPTAQIPTNGGGLKAPEFLQPSLQQPAPKFEPPPAITPPPTKVVVAVQPPRPTQQVKPIVPQNAIAMLKRTVDVQVRVYVNETGKVVNAEPVGSAAGLYQYLTASALQAARNWKFQPAQRGTTPVASDIILHFLFEPSAR
jgi:TonB family protein